MLADEVTARAGRRGERGTVVRFHVRSRSRVSAAPGRVRLLVVDADRFSGRSLSSFLTGEGHEVALAASASAGRPRHRFLLRDRPRHRHRAGPRGRGGHPQRPRRRPATRPARPPPSTASSPRAGPRRWCTTCAAPAPVSGPTRSRVMSIVAEEAPNGSSPSCAGSSPSIPAQPIRRSWKMPWAQSDQRTDLSRVERSANVVPSPLACRPRRPGRLSLGEICGELLVGRG